MNKNRVLPTLTDECIHTARFLVRRFGLYNPKHSDYENNRYTIEKPYKLATRNAKKNFEINKKILENGKVPNVLFC